MGTEWVSLRKFLGRGDICHPTILSGVQISDEAGILLRLQGAAWWKPDSMIEAKYEFRFLGIKDIQFRHSLITSATKDWPGVDDEVLEYFEHAPVSETPWGKGDAHEIYCSSPIQNPQNLLLALNAALHATNSPYDCMSHLNYAGRLDAFFQLCRQKTFKLGTFRGEVLGAVKEELISQAVSFSALPGKTGIEGCVFTRIEDSFILSDIAQAREIGDLQDAPDHPL